MHEEPIVCSPDDAIRAFLQGNLDYLAIGDSLAAHPSSRH
jgi:carbamoyltransferase